MSGSSVELDRCGRQGFGESPAASPRGLGSGSLPTASTDSLAADTSEEHFLHLLLTAHSLPLMIPLIIPGLPLTAAAPH